MFKGSIATPSLEAAIINAKYVNSNPLDRIAKDFQENGLNLSKQTMSNWTVWTAERYLSPVCDFMRKRQLEAHVNQSDETPVDVIHDGRPAGSKSYMWVHITGELSPVPPIIIYEYQKTRHSDHPKAYYKDFDGILMTDGLEQYHKLERDLDGVKNANCMAHARRHFANAIKAIGKSNPEAVEASVAYKALVRIGAIYDLEGALKNRKSSIISTCSSYHISEIIAPINISKHDFVQFARFVRIVSLYPGGLSYECKTKTSSGPSSRMGWPLCGTENQRTDCPAMV